MQSEGNACDKEIDVETECDKIVANVANVPFGQGRDRRTTGPPVLRAPARGLVFFQIGDLILESTRSHVLSSVRNDINYN
jgi:hypothetical protein